MGDLRQRKNIHAPVPMVTFEKSKPFTLVVSKANRRYGKSPHTRRSVIFPRTGLLIWQLGRSEVICFIVVWCNLWEFHAMVFDEIPHNPILCMVGGWRDEDSSLR